MACGGADRRGLARGVPRGLVAAGPAQLLMGPIRDSVRPALAARWRYSLASVSFMTTCSRVLRGSAKPGPEAKCPRRPDGPGDGLREIGFAAGDVPAHGAERFDVVYVAGQERDAHLRYPRERLLDVQ